MVFSNIEEIKNQLLQNKDNYEYLKKLYEVSHSMMGVSGMFGFPTLSNAAYELEFYLKSVADNQLENIDIKQIIELIYKLKQSFTEIEMS